MESLLERPLIVSQGPGRRKVLFPYQASSAGMGLSQGGHEGGPTNRAERRLDGPDSREAVRAEPRLPFLEKCPAAGAWRGEKELKEFSEKEMHALQDEAWPFGDRRGK